MASLAVIAVVTDVSNFGIGKALAPKKANIWGSVGSFPIPGCLQRRAVGMSQLLMLWHKVVTYKVHASRCYIHIFVLQISAQSNNCYLMKFPILCWAISLLS